MTPAVQAAGALCWRVVDGKVVVLVVHRPRHGDVSLPKGKLERGESLPRCAVREILEETGLAIALGVPLGTSHYRIAGGREKVVHYWAAEVTDEAVTASTFLPGDEVSALEWLSLKKVRKRLTYPHDVAIIDAFERLVATGITATFALIALRHAKAVAHEDWKRQDAARPLTKTGLRQAAGDVTTLEAWRPHRILTSPAVRCVQTVAPLSAATHRKARLIEGLSQDAHDEGAGTVRETVGERVRKGRTAVLCSHGPVLPEILREIALATGTVMSPAIRDAAALDTGGFSVVHLSRRNPAAGIVAIETHPPTA